MIYLDTSVVVALLNLGGSASPHALDWLAQCRGTLISSDWVITETHSALGIKQRQIHASSPQGPPGRRGPVRRRLLQGGVETALACSRTAFGSGSRKLLQDPALPLRAADALHLAVALHSRCTQLGQL